MPLDKQSAEVWGAEGVQPHDIDHGLESIQTQPARNYWDGKIMEGP